jgi:hypothetical protein
VGSRFATAARRAEHKKLKAAIPGAIPEGHGKVEEPPVVVPPPPVAPRAQPDSPMHSFGPLTEPSPTASALRPSHVTDSLTVPWALVHRRSRVVVAPPNNVLFLENLPTECTEMMLSMLFQSAAHADALSPCSTRHMRCDSLERHRQRS